MKRRSVPPLTIERITPPAEALKGLRQESFTAEQAAGMTRTVDKVEPGAKLVTVAQLQWQKATAARFRDQHDSLNCGPKDL